MSYPIRLVFPQRHIVMQSNESLGVLWDNNVIFVPVTRLWLGAIVTGCGKLQEVDDAGHGA